MALPNAMKLVDFSVQEEACRPKRMVLHCPWKRAKGSNKDDSVTFPPELIDLSKEGTMSSVTKDSSGVEEVMVETKSTKVPRIRMSIKSARLHCTAAVKEKRQYNQALKRARVIYDRKQKKPDGMSAQTVVDLIKNELGVQLSKQTIQQKVKDRNVGMLPLRGGSKGNIPEHHYHNLCMAYKLFPTINQLNGALRVCRPQQVGPLVQKVIIGENGGGRDWPVLFRRVQTNTATNLRREKARSTEDRQIHWTTHKNTLMWFDNWEHDIVELGFGNHNPVTGKVHNPKEQLQRIGNFDKTCLSFDGSNTNLGGHPDCTICNPQFPVVGIATLKTSLSATLITGSTSAGKVFPPHIQFQAKA
jgi:hypothetical protein